MKIDLLTSKRKKLRLWMAGLALVELVVTVAAISIVAATGVVVVQQVQTSSMDVKLESDVREVNNAIRIYKTAGGSLESVTEPQEVLNKLKTVATTEGHHNREIMFVKGSVVDLRLRTVGMNEKWRGGKKYARYDTVKEKFEVVPVPGEDGFKGFVLDEAAVFSAKEYRKVVFKQSKSDEWVWDHAPVAENIPQDVPLDAPSEDAKTNEYTVTSHPGLATAKVPVISPGLPQSLLSTYPLTATISDPDNEEGTTRLYYKIGEGEFRPYTGPLPVAPGTKVSAFAASINSEKLYDSATVATVYVPDPVVPRLGDTLASAVTYFDLGGPRISGAAMPAPVPALKSYGIFLENGDEIPPHYETSENFVVKISLGGRLVQGAAFAGSYPGDVIPLTLGDFSANGVASVSYRAEAINEMLFKTSEPVAKTVQASVLPLSAPVLTLTPTNQIFIAPNFDAGALPQNLRIYYRIGEDPGYASGEPQSGASLYTSPVNMPSGGGTLYARMYPPSNYKAWFDVSPVSSFKYIPTAEPPVISPKAPQSSLAVYPISATISDPNPSGSTQLYYRLNNGGTYTKYTGPVAIEPGTTITAYAASKKPEDLHDSTTVSNLYVPDPVVPRLSDTLAAAATYFDLGGPGVPGSSVPASKSYAISLQNGNEIPSKYETSANFIIEMTLGSRSVQGAAFSGQYPGDVIPLKLSDFSSGGAASVSYKAKTLNTQLFTTSDPVAKTVQASALSLSAPLLTLADNKVTIAPNMAAGSLPQDYRIYYRIGADPGHASGEPQSGAIPYTSPVAMPSGGGILYARVYPPSNYKAWFNTSPVSSLEVQDEEEGEGPADYMGYYNVIVFNNVWTPNSLDGKTWTGGSWTNGNSFNVAQDYSPSGPERVTVVGVSVGSGNPINMNGNSNSKLVVTSTSVRGSRTINGVPANSPRLVIDPDIPAKTQELRTQLTALSQTLSQASANSSLVVNGNNRTFECKPNAQGIAIFNIQPGQLFQAQNAGGDIKMASGYDVSQLKGVLINVSGTSVNTSSSVNLNGNLRQESWTSKIIWNFPSATTVDMAAQWMGGSVLAPKASVKTMNDFKGNVVCENLNVASVRRQSFNAQPVLNLAK